MNRGEHVVDSTRTLPEALTLPIMIGMDDIPGMERMQLLGAESLHRLSTGERTDDGT